MKKLTALLVVMTMLLALGTTAFAAIDTTMPFLFKAANATPTIDGVKDEAYSNSEVIDIKQPGLTSTYVDGHATAQVWTLWDDANIYFYAEINDSTPSNKYFDGMNGWEIDSVEIYVDYANIKFDTSASIHHEPLTGKFRLFRSPDCDIIESTSAIGVELGDKVQYKVVDSAEGYVVEAAIPHKELSSKIGFSFQINDDMNDDQLRDIAVFTKDMGYLACQFNYVFDSLDLEGCTATNGYEDDFIEYLTPEDLAELNTPVVEEPTDEPSDEPIDEPIDEPVDEPSDEPTDVGPKTDAGINPIVWVIVGAVVVVAVVVVVIVATKKKK